MDLYPTPTRLQLLRDIAAGRVTYYPGVMGLDAESRVSETSGRRDRKVTAACEELRRAGWADLATPRRGERHWAHRPWGLTDKGREILAGAS